MFQLLKSICVGILLFTAIINVSAQETEGPSESECRPYIEKALQGATQPSEDTNPLSDEGNIEASTEQALSKEIENEDLSINDDNTGQIVETEQSSENPTSNEENETTNENETGENESQQVSEEAQTESVEENVEQSTVESEEKDDEKQETENQESIESNQVEDEQESGEPVVKKIDELFEHAHDEETVSNEENANEEPSDETTDTTGAQEESIEQNDEAAAESQELQSGEENNREITSQEDQEAASKEGEEKSEENPTASEDEETKEVQSDEIVKETEEEGEEASGIQQSEELEEKVAEESIEETQSEEKSQAEGEETTGSQEAAGEDSGDEQSVEAVGETNEESTEDTVSNAEQSAETVEGEEQSAETASDAVEQSGETVGEEETEQSIETASEAVEQSTEEEEKAASNAEQSTETVENVEEQSAETVGDVEQSVEEAASDTEQSAETAGDVEQSVETPSDAESIEKTAGDDTVEQSDETVENVEQSEEESKVDEVSEEKLVDESVEAETDKGSETVSKEEITTDDEKSQETDEIKEGSEEEANAVEGSEQEKAEELPEEEELTMIMEIPEKLRPREHMAQILHLDGETEETEQILSKTVEHTLKELKKLYEAAIKPLEILYKYRDLSNRHFGDPEIFSKPLILFMGPWSGGKSTIINYLLENEYKHTALRTGADPSPAYFNIVMWGEDAEILDGTQLAADWTFSGLQKFGQVLLDRLRGLKLNHPLLQKVNIVEIPGILEIRKQVERMFPFNDACQWFIDRADIIFLVYDPSKLDIGPETEAILDQLKGREMQTRIILNKADQVKPEELMRVQGTLIWNISPLMSSTEPPVMYSTSLWSLPYEAGSPTRLLHAQEKAFLSDLRTAIDKRVENKIAGARRFAVRVRNHAKMVDCYLTTYYNHKSFFDNKKHVSDDIIEHPQNYHIYEGLSTLTNISRYDLPDPDVYRDFFRLNPVYEFQQLSSTCTYFRGCPINRLDLAIAYDLPELVGKYKKSVEELLKSYNSRK